MFPPCVAAFRYGQTNCWVLPEGKYGAFKGLDGEIYVMTQRAALNLSYQVGVKRRGDDAYVPFLLISTLDSLTTP